MRERPIMFKGEMVRAILEGTKTQTRRPVKHRHEWAIEERDGKPWPLHPPYVYAEDDAWMNCPYGVPGDRLYVKETWAPSFKAPKCQVAYRADGRCYGIGGDGDGGRIHVFHGWLIDAAARGEELGNTLGRSLYQPWRSSMMMPRWASRIMLEIVSVRVERVNSMTLADARAEGIPQMHAEAVAAGLCAETHVVVKDGPTCRDVWDNRTSVENFAALWDSLYAKTPNAWAANPWVWIIEFRRVDGGTNHG